jgi:uncharacterized membrane protein (UPF0127 family)
MALLRNSTTDRIVATRIDRLSGFLQRAVGLLARNSLAQDEGVWIARCNAIHTMGMRVPIDVVWVDGEGRVLRMEPNVRPNRFALACPQAEAVIELGCGALGDGEIAAGDYLELVA